MLLIRRGGRASRGLAPGRHGIGGEGAVGRRVGEVGAVPRPPPAATCSRTVPLPPGKGGPSAHPSASLSLFEFPETAATAAPVLNTALLWEVGLICLILHLSLCSPRWSAFASERQVDFMLLAFPETARGVESGPRTWLRPGAAGLNWDGDGRGGVVFPAWLSWWDGDRTAGPARGHGTVFFQSHLP